MNRGASRLVFLLDSKVDSNKTHSLEDVILILNPNPSSSLEDVTLILKRPNPPSSLGDVSLILKPNPSIPL